MAENPAIINGTSSITWGLLASILGELVMIFLLEGIPISLPAPALELWSVAENSSNVFRRVSLNGNRLVGSLMLLGNCCCLDFVKISKILK